MDALRRRRLPGIHVRRGAFAGVLTAAALLGCENEPSASPAPSAVLARATEAPSAPPAPTPLEAAPAAPKSKKRLEDCPKGGSVQFAQPEVEAEVRRKLPKAEGPITSADLRRLRSLNLSQVKLDELDVCVFTHMKGLKELFLGTGEYDDLSPLAGSTRIESLRASVNAVRDLSPLAGMTRMDRLDLGRTQLRDLTPLAGMTKLTELQLDDTPVQDVSPLAQLSNLETLSLKRTQVKDVSALKGLKKLKFLYINGSPLDADPMSVAAVRGNGTKVIAE